MIEFKLECSSCGFDRIIDDREFIEDLRQCPSCGSDNIEIVQTGESPPERQIDPAERDRFVRRRMFLICAIGILLLLVGIGLFSLAPLASAIFFPLGITLIVIGVLLILISMGWLTDGTCCFSC